MKTFSFLSTRYILLNQLDTLKIWGDSFQTEGKLWKKNAQCSCSIHRTYLAIGSTNKRKNSMDGKLFFFIKKDSFCTIFPFSHNRFKYGRVCNLIWTMFLLNRSYPKFLPNEKSFWEECRWKIFSKTTHVTY